MKAQVVIGSYRCGCTYGPIKKRDRLSYCGIHGQEILAEYLDYSQSVGKRRKHGRSRRRTMRR